MVLQDGQYSGPMNGKREPRQRNRRHRLLKRNRALDRIVEGIQQSGSQKEMSGQKFTFRDGPE
jgi:hypothetical protein